VRLEVRNVASGMSEGTCDTAAGMLTSVTTLACNKSPRVACMIHRQRMLFDSVVDCKAAGCGHAPAVSSVTCLGRHGGAVLTSCLPAGAARVCALRLSVAALHGLHRALPAGWVNGGLGVCEYLSAQLPLGSASMLCFPFFSMCWEYASPHPAAPCPRMYVLSFTFR
jgi:hypothetical protein